MKRASRRIASMLISFGMAAAMAVSAFAGVPEAEAGQRSLPEVEYNNHNGKYITILSPHDGDTFCPGQAISYSFTSKDTWSSKDYFTKPYIELRKQGAKSPAYHTMFEAFKGENAVKGFSGTIDLAKISPVLTPGTYRVGVGNYAFKTKNSKQHDSNAGKTIPLSTLDITIIDHEWDAGVVTTEPDGGVEGVKVYTCARCHQTKTEAIAAIPVTIPKTPASVKAKAKKKSVTVSWKKIRKTKKTKALLKQITSIEVEYSTNPAFPRAETTRMPGLSKRKTKVTLKTLTPKTVYYFRVRYVGSDGVSNWSKVKKVKTR